MKSPECVDCIADGVTTWRPIKSGTRKPRCATHHRIVRKQAQLNAHARTVETGYGVTGEQYWALYEAQGGKCALCRVATGKTKRLAVDHDHDCPEDHPREQGCPKCVRGLICGPCNQMLGRCPRGTFQRAIEYLDEPPARKLLAQMLQKSQASQPVVIVPEQISESESFWAWTPFDEDGMLDTERLTDDGWWFVSAMSDETC